MVVLSAGVGPVWRLAEFFRRSGYEVDVEGDVLWLRSDRVSGVVRVVGEDAGPSELLSAVIEAARDAAAGFLTYIAAPKNIIDRVGEHVFRLHGLGLLKYTDIGVNESVSPRIRETSRPPTQPRPPPNSPDIAAALEKLLKKVEAIESRLEHHGRPEMPKAVERNLEPGLLGLMSRLEELERRVGGLERLAEEVAELREKVRALVERGIQPSAEKPRAKPEQHVSAGGVPSFVENNPWVELLAKKGQK